MPLTRNAARLLVVLTGLGALGCAQEASFPSASERSAEAPSAALPKLAGSQSANDGGRIFRKASKASLAVPLESMTPRYPSTGIEFWDPPANTGGAGDAQREERNSVTPDEERRAIAAARRFLDIDGNFDPEFKVTRTQDGYSVFVVFAMVPGGHCSVEISNDWKVVELIKGL